MNKITIEVGMISATNAVYALKYNFFEYMWILRRFSSRFYDTYKLRNISLTEELN